MKIEELILDGFKSYPVRTTITGWDSSFNAITGLNGSGKSNILDAIAFVLGLTNTSLMRAQTMADLIYKKGQAGVTKASVTIVFDNSDREKSPVGMENTQQITVTRQFALPNTTKWLVNGHKWTQANVHNIFQSVGLNINNPNFVIMQGRITKVLNMRPQEILGMVEEAAGTRMFEERKDKAKKTISKKEKRVAEIQDTLDADIGPKLAKLRKDKAAYMEWQSACSELERIQRVLAAWEWVTANQKVDELGEKIEQRKQDTKTVQEGKERAKKEEKAATNQIKEVAKRKEDEMKKGGKLNKLEADVKEKDQEVAKIAAQVEIKEGVVKEEQDKVVNEEAQATEAGKALDKAKTTAAKLSAAFDKVKASHDAENLKLASDEELLQTLLTGLSSNNTNAAGGGGYMGQLAAAQQRATRAAAEEEGNSKRLGAAQAELSTLEKKRKEGEKEADKGRKDLDKAKSDVAAIQRKIDKSGWNAELEKQADEKLAGLRNKIRTLTGGRDSDKQAVASIIFEGYPSPFPNFDRTKVLGKLGSLISLPEEHRDKAAALEVTAGGRLHNVVVADEKVGKDLLSAKLSQRVTLIPLTKINASRMRPEKLSAAHKIAPGKVHLALDLIKYPQYLTPAMTFAFGNTLICADPQSAQACTYSDLVNTRSVTLDGDVYEPGGTMSGGSRPQGSGVLLKVQKWLKAEDALKVAQKEFETLSQREKEYSPVKAEWAKLNGELELKKHEVQLYEQQLASSSSAKIAEQIEQLTDTISSLKDAVQEAVATQKAAKEECKKLEKDMAEFKTNKDGKIEELRASIGKQKKVIQQKAVSVKTQQKEVQTAQLELEQYQQDLENAHQAHADAQVSVSALQRELAKLNSELANAKAIHDAVYAKLKEEQATLSRFDQEIADLEAVVKDRKEAQATAEVELQKITHSIENAEKQLVAAANRVQALEEEYDWISEEKDNFGKAGGPFNFKAMNMEELDAKAKNLEKSKESKKKKLNPKVMIMIDQVEKKEADAKRMMETVLVDRQKIEDTIAQLDQFKREAMEKTWTTVNSEFGAIFAELLPGNFAKLQPPQGQDFMEGLEVKVQLGQVWKQSLTELSGGQRSLIALSLIMALLRFKPAPMYILDEIDAALDLSHTQHIGQLFRTRFKGSQFIVVSLKEGLFTNANVLFRAKFRDGTSLVERTAQRSTSTLYN